MSQDNCQGALLNATLYVQVFKRIEKSLPQLTTLDLQYVSPELLKARNLELAVPGAFMLLFDAVDQT